LDFYPIQTKKTWPARFTVQFSKIKSAASRACQLHFSFYLVFNRLSTSFFFRSSQPAAQSHSRRATRRQYTGGGGGRQ